MTNVTSLQVILSLIDRSFQSDPVLSKATIASLKIPMNLCFHDVLFTKITIEYEFYI